MTRKDVLSVMSNYYGVNQKTSENYYDYLVKHKMLPQLKRDGRVVSAQPTTTNRTAITTEKLLRNHNNFEVAMNEVRALNDNSEEFKNVEDYFNINLDESNFMACNGQLKVIGSKEKRKTEKNTSDSRESVICVRMGSAAGTEVSKHYSLSIENSYNSILTSYLSMLSIGASSISCSWKNRSI